jgi:hypothetical protein
VADSINVDFAGLITAPGVYKRKAASFLQAWNALFEQPGVLRVRPGMERLAGATGGPIYAIATARALDDKVLVNYGSSLQANALRYGNGSGPLTAISGTVSNRIDRRMRTEQSNRNMYLTSDEGVRRLDTNFSLAFAGMPRGLPCDRGQFTGTIYTPLTGTGGILADGSTRAYRVSWHLRDPEQVELGGSPLGRHLVRNKTGTNGYGAGAARNVVNRILLPAQFGTASTALTTSYYYRLWASRTSTGEPDDEMYLIAEAFLTSTDITNGYVDVTDTTSDAVLVTGPALHTNANDYLSPSPLIRKGILSADEPPPLARDLVLYKDHLLYAETKSRPYFNVTLIALPADGDTFSAGGSTFTFKTVPVGVNQVQIVTAYASLSDNIEATARNLVDHINHVTTTVYAFYISGPSQLPGQLYIESRNMATFSVASSTGGTKYRPQLTVGGTGSLQDVKNNAIWASKPLRADAVPPTNVWTAGPNDARLLRSVAFRDFVFLFTDYGVYTFSGSSPQDFEVSPFNLTLHLLAREAVVVCDDAVYAWCREGIARLDQSGAEIISNGFENFVTSVVAPVGLDTFGQTAFAVAYQTQHKVAFFYPQSADPDPTTGTILCPYALVYDTRSNAWSGWRVDRMYTNPSATPFRLGYTCGAVSWKDDRFFLADWNHANTDAFLYRQRRSYDQTDYQDDYQDATVDVVRPKLQLAYQSPDPTEAFHWQELIIDWETDAILGGRVPPTSPLEITFTTEQTSVTVPLVPVADPQRVPVPQSCQRSKRLSVTIGRDASAVTVEGFGIVSMSLRYGSSSARATK